MEGWGFLTNHGRVLVCIARDPGVRLRDIATALDITERSAHGIIADLTAAGYVVKRKHGRRNSYQIQAHLPLPEPATPEPAIGDVLAVLIGERARQDTTDAPGDPGPDALSARDGFQPGDRRMRLARQRVSGVS
jgi:hypothetical protein